MARRRSLLASIAFCCSLALGLASAASAHIVRAQQTLLALVGGSERVVHAQILDPNEIVTLEESGEQRPGVRIALREVIKGEGLPGEIVLFAVHGHGVAEYATGDQALIFLRPLSTNRELAVLQQAEVRWVSTQDHDSRFVLSEGSSKRVLAAARGYAAAEREADPAKRLDALRRIALDLLTSRDPQLAASAIGDIVAPAGAGMVRREDVPRLLTEVIDPPTTAISVRVGLLVALESRGVIDGRPVWERLLRMTPEPDLLQVVRAAGRHPSDRVDALLIEMLKGDAAVAEAAALALANPAHADAVPALAVALGRPEPRVRMASIRALGGIGTPAALSALEAAAASHTDEAIRRRAAAEVRSGSVAR